MAEDRVGRTLGIESLMIANTQQLRHLAGSARRWNFPFQLDFRINTMLDQGGLHTLMFDSLATSDPSAEVINDGDRIAFNPAGSSMYLRVLVYTKMVGLTADEPFSSFLMVRFRDFIWLQLPEGGISDQMARARLALPRDEWTPDDADPEMLDNTGLALRPHGPGANAAYRFKPATERSEELPRRTAGAAMNSYGRVLNEVSMRAPFDDPRYISPEERQNRPGLERAALPGLFREAALPTLERLQAEDLPPSLRALRKPTREG